MQERRVHQHPYHEYGIDDGLHAGGGACVPATAVRDAPGPWSEMKKILIALGVLVLIGGGVCYNVWRASVDPVTSTPGPLEIGRQQLHAQLEESKQREAAIELQDWNSIPLLRGLIDAHQHRIEQLSGNSQGGEIVAHDREAIARLEKRISDLIEEEAARAAAQAKAQEQRELDGSNSATTPGTPSAPKPAPAPGPQRNPQQ